jgi:hypothetical protein
MSDAVVVQTDEAAVSRIGLFWLAAQFAGEPIHGSRRLPYFGASGDISTCNAA